MANIGITKYTSQYIDNMSFDDALKVKLVEVINPDGTLNEPDPLENYNLANLDTSTVPIYVGKLDKDGNWYIMKLDLSTTTVTYVKGTTDYSTNWTNRATLTYDTFENLW